MEGRYEENVDMKEGRNREGMKKCHGEMMEAREGHCGTKEGRKEGRKKSAPWKEGGQEGRIVMEGRMEGRKEGRTVYRKEGA